MVVVLFAVIKEKHGLPRDPHPSASLVGDRVPDAVCCAGLPLPLNEGPESKSELARINEGGGEFFAW